MDDMMGLGYSDEQREKMLKGTTGNKSASVTGYTLGDYDRWFKPCENCGYDTGKASEKSEARCWKCGRPIQRDYSERALKRSV